MSRRSRPIAWWLVPLLFTGTFLLAVVPVVWPRVLRERRAALIDRVEGELSELRRHASPPLPPLWEGGDDGTGIDGLDPDEGRAEQDLAAILTLRLSGATEPTRPEPSEMEAMSRAADVYIELAAAGAPGPLRAPRALLVDGLASDAETCLRVVADVLAIAQRHARRAGAEDYEAFASRTRDATAPLGSCLSRATPAEIARVAPAYERLASRQPMPTEALLVELYRASLALLRALPEPHAPFTIEAAHRFLTYPRRLEEIETGVETISDLEAAAQTREEVLIHALLSGAADDLPGDRGIRRAAFSLAEATTRIRIAALAVTTLAEDELPPRAEKVSRDAFEGAPLEVERRDRALVVRFPGSDRAAPIVLRVERISTAATEMPPRKGASRRLGAKRSAGSREQPLARGRRGA